MNEQLKPYVDSKNPGYNITLPTARALVTALRKLRNYNVAGIFAEPGINTQNTQSAVTEQQLIALGATDADALFLQIMTDDGTLRMAWELLENMMDPNLDSGITKIMSDRFGWSVGPMLATTAIVTMPEVQSALKAALAIK